MKQKIGIRRFMKEMLINNITNYGQDQISWTQNVDIDDDTIDAERNKFTKYI